VTGLLFFWAAGKGNFWGQEMGLKEGASQVSMEQGRQVISGTLGKEDT